MGRVDNQNRLVQGAEVQNRGAGLGANSGQSLKPGDSRFGRPHVEEIQVQRATPTHYQSQCGRQKHRFALRMSDRIYQPSDFLWLRMRQIFPARIAVRQSCKRALGDRLAGSAAQHCQHELAHRIEAIIRRRRAKCIEQSSMDLGEATVRCDG